jgi:hypothetical protein
MLLSQQALRDTRRNIFPYSLHTRSVQRSHAFWWRSFTFPTNDVFHRHNPSIAQKSWTFHA